VERTGRTRGANSAGATDGPPFTTTLGAMTDTSLTETRSQRRQLFVLALAPVPAICVLVVSALPWSLERLPLVFGLTLAFGYFTYLLAGLPLLLALKHLRLLTWYNLALAGFASVFIVWLVPRLLVPSAWQPDSVWSLATGLFYPAALAAATGIMMWFLAFRGTHGT
jgi:hypothetical protein